MISVDEATARITGAFAPLEAETLAVGHGHGRVLAQDMHARMDQPPAAMSAMDGYAVRYADARQAGVVLDVIGAAPAGRPFSGPIGPGQAVRIFTGGVVPDGADTIVIQENADLEGETVRLRLAAEPERHIRRAGLDFTKGELLATAGQRLSSRDLSLLAAGDLAELNVRRRPRIALAATGDELTLPGAPKPKGAIVASSGYALAAMIEKWGGAVINLGIVPDRDAAIAALPERAGDADLLVTLGGASVGDHDLIQKALGPRGLHIDFWKIAMRPGKPLVFGRIGKLPLLGLPGNPVSSIVCALLFLKPAIHTMLGYKAETIAPRARLAVALSANDSRQDHLRARREWRQGEPFVTPFSRQDSSMLSALARSDVLIVRRPHAPAAEAGSLVEVLDLDAG